MSTPSRPLIAIHQPNPFPRLKVCAKLIKADTVVSLDQVQFVRREWQNRFCLREYRPPHSLVMFTFSAKTRGKYHSTIAEMELCDFKRDRARLLSTVKHLYGRSPHFEIFLEAIAAIPDVRTVAELGTASMNYVLAKCGRPAMVEQPTNTIGRRNELLIEICRRFGAAAYLSGSGGTTYLKPNLFVASGVTPFVHQWHPPDDHLEWRNISYLDFVGRYGWAHLIEHLLGGHNGIARLA